MSPDEQKRLAAERIKAFRESLDMDQEAFANFLDMGENGQSTISKWERAKQLPGSKHTAKLAQKSGLSSIYFSGLTPVTGQEIAQARSYPMIGEIQAGAWREAIAFEDDDIHLVSIPYVADVPPYNMRAFVVRGNSMDQVYPDGSVVFVAGLHENRITPEDGDVVVVQRQDQQGLYEATLKELVVDDDGQKWLWPRSSDPQHQAPLAVDSGRDTSTDVLVLGIVQAAIVKPKRRRPR